MSFSQGTNAHYESSKAHLPIDEVCPQVVLVILVFLDTGSPHLFPGVKLDLTIYATMRRFGRVKVYREFSD
ncbi:MAG: hypothetical protein QXR70_03425 [Sulfolobales archaeon]